MTLTKARPGYIYTTAEMLETILCCKCGVLFGAPERLLDARRRDGLSFWCPNGHSQGWKETEADRLKRDLKSTRDDLARVRAERDQVEASRRAIRGVVTKLRDRVGAGECPVCGKHLYHLARHVGRVHPGYSDATAGEP